MEITYPREKRKIKLSKSGVIYVLLGKGISPEWYVMDFWNLPYTFRYYKDAVKGAKIIQKKLVKYNWEDTKVVIARIAL